MTSTYDEPGNPTLPHPAELRELDDAGRAREGIDPAGEPVRPAAATAYRSRDLDDADQARMLNLVIGTFGLDPLYVANTFHVARTRRGYIVMLTEYDHDEQTGEQMAVLGVPLVRHHIRPIAADELPAACRAHR